MSYIKIPENFVGHEHGCKVSWRFYKTRDEANAAAKIADHNARIDEASGYDFGFCSPGIIDYVDTGDHAGLYRVCFSC